MGQGKRWLIPAASIGIIGLIIFAAGKFADQPIIFLRGDISISQELLPKATVQQALFFVLYDADSAAPMPFGAMKDEISIGPSFDRTDFLLTPARLQIMQPGGPMPKAFRLKVRLDQDGLGGPDQTGDMVGEIARVSFGSENVQVNISKVIP